MNTRLITLFPFVFALACAEMELPADEAVDPENECVLCDDRADAYGIARNSYLAYGILELANTATLEILDDEVPLDVRAARGIVAQRPFEYIEQLDTVSYVGRVAFSRLAAYAENNGYVPFCGDGVLQPLLEACDDGNASNGDGCSSTCQIEEGVDTFFAEQPELIQGANINVNLVDPNGYYLRSRPFKNLTLEPKLKAILDRADKIQANTANDGIVQWDELAILSKEPFYSSLFTDERNALRDAWAMMEVNTAPVAVIEWTGGNIQNTIPYEVKIERPGPVVVVPIRTISALETETQKSVSRRLQQMPGMNADNNPNTVELADLEKGIEDYSLVFTAAEVRAMQAIIDKMFADALPSSGGDFAIEFSQLPNTANQTQTITEFDGWKFSLSTRFEMHHDAYDPRPYQQQYSFDGNLVTDFSFKTSLSFNGRSNSFCGTSIGPCSTIPFRHMGVRYMRLDGEQVTPGSSRGIMLMEHWQNGKRVYNRFVDFRNSFREHDRRTNLSEFIAARPALPGQPLSLRKTDTVSYGSGKTYTRFGLTQVQTEFNKNLEKFFPESQNMLQNRLKPGRYEEFEGVVLDIHDSGAVIAYFDGCVLPLAFKRGQLESKQCNNGRKVSISFTNIRATLNVQAGTWKSIDLYDSNSYYNGTNLDQLLDLDRAYYIIQ